MPRDKITPFLWFDDQAEEAARFYVSLFPNSAIQHITHVPGGKAVVVAFQLAGRDYLALNGGPTFKLSEAFSLSVDCESQEEIDSLWDKLTADGGQPSQCGWLKDRFGLSWQIVPSILPGLLRGDPARAQAVMGAVMKMGKLDIATLKAAAGI